MVEEIKAYKSGDGQIHGSHLDAAKHEARASLTKCLKNTALVNEVMASGRCVFDALQEVLFAENIIESKAVYATALVEKVQA